MIAPPTIVQIGSPFHSVRGGIAPEAIVLHIMDGTLAACDAWFSDPRAQVSAHFGVGKDGTIHQYVALDQGAWANGLIEAGHTAALVDENGGMNPNRWTVSIEHEGNYPDEPTDAQFAASTQLTAWLFDSLLLTSGATGVAIDRKHILRHAEISPVTRPNCPGWSGATLTRYVDQVQRLVAGPAPTPGPDVAAAILHLEAALAALRRP